MQPELSFFTAAQASERWSWMLLFFGWGALSGNIWWGTTRPLGPSLPWKDPTKAEGKRVLFLWKLAEALKGKHLIEIVVILSLVLYFWSLRLLHKASPPEEWNITDLKVSLISGTQNCRCCAYLPISSTVGNKILHVPVFRWKIMCS